MKDTSIKHAWEQWVAKLPVRPDEIQDMVTSVAYELATAASTDPERNFDEETSSVKLPHGLTIQLEEQGNERTGLRRCEIQLVIAGTDGARTGKFLAQAELDGPPAISDANCAESTATITTIKYWKEQDGPQKAWITNNLRQQVVEFIAGGGE